jgi:hypothetical protein
MEFNSSVNTNSFLDARTIQLKIHCSKDLNFLTWGRAEEGHNSPTLDSVRMGRKKSSAAEGRRIRRIGGRMGGGDE